VSNRASAGYLTEYERQIESGKKIVLSILAELAATLDHPDAKGLKFHVTSVEDLFAKVCNLIQITTSRKCYKACGKLENEKPVGVAAPSREPKMEIPAKGNLGGQTARRARKKHFLMTDRMKLRGINTRGPGAAVAALAAPKVAARAQAMASTSIFPKSTRRDSDEDSTDDG
jgi:hypothetical protein